MRRAYIDEIQVADHEELRVALFGQPFWAARLSETVNRHSDQMRCMDFSSRYMPIAPDGTTLRSFDPHLMVRIGFRPGSNTTRGRAYELYWRVIRQSALHALDAYYWIGTDVSDALHQEASGGPTRAFRQAKNTASHCAGAPWLCQELQSIGIVADFVPFPVELRITENSAKFAARFQVVTYVPDARPELYGGYDVIDIASAMPEIDFIVAGGRGSWAPQSRPNVRFAGWVDDFSKLLQQSHVLLRMVQHDGYGATVREALALGRYVIYTYPAVGCVYVKPGDINAIIKSLRSLKYKHDASNLLPNAYGQKYVLEQLSERQCVERFVGWSLRAVGMQL